MMRYLLLVTLIPLASCTGIPEHLTAVQPFELNRYLGTWHEVARQDHRFERGLTQVTANYQLQADGSVQVINRGFSVADQQWQQAEGVAKFVDDSPSGRQQARLKVSFFGPFYGAYNVVKLTANYDMALVVGPDLSYAWLLARTNTPKAADCQAFYQYAESIGIAKGSWQQLLTCQ